MRKLILLSLLLTIAFRLFAQFGQNKVMYDHFDFEVYKTPQFDIYNYVKNDTVLFNLGQLTERWYLRHSAIFQDTLHNSPIILYNNAADFKQTTVISGIIGVGTGGVTEGLRSRVIIPIMVSNKETDHVLGHEMVHVFQYNMVRKNDSLSFQHLANIPLWVIEGMAEFLSIGSTDNRTAMWMRDAAIHNNIPSLRDLTRKQAEYFPYRYGHAFWAYVTGTWGDSILYPMFHKTLKYGFLHATKELLGFEPDSLSTLWENALQTYNTSFLIDTIAPVGKLMYDDKTGGEINLSPVLSPDGKKIIFLSNKDVLKVDLLLADAENNKILSKLTSSLRKSHIDDFNYIEEAGSWSHDGKKYVVSTFTGGKNKILILNLKNDKIKSSEEIEFENIDALINPEWSPNGEKIVFNGLVAGKSDLYLYNTLNRQLTQLTNDFHSDLQPSWSTSGTEIAFISDRGSDTNIEKQVYGNYRLCVLKLATNQIITYDLFPGANIFSPQYSPSDSSLYFLSNADGFRNLYRYHLHDDEIFKLTKFATGISGITDLAPAYSVASETGQIAYTLYTNGNYEIYLADSDEFLQIPVNATDVDLTAEQLAPGKERMNNVIDQNLNLKTEFSEDSFKIQAYDPKFQIEYVGSNGIGVGYSSYGNYASGGISLLMSDMLKQHQIYTLLNINGEVYDFGGQLAYINSKHRINWGLSFSHFPYRTIHHGSSIDSSENLLINNYSLVRIFEEDFSFFSQYPFSSKIRLEAGISYSHYSYRVDSVNNYYQLDANNSVVTSYLGHNKKKAKNIPDPFNVGTVYLALVGDNSNFGVTSPMAGYRYRLQAAQMFDSYNTTTLTIDLRKYFFLKPISLGFKLLHYGRYGKSANELYPLYLGNDFLIRGYNFSAINKSREEYTPNYLEVNKISGSKVVVVNSEFRLPLTGIKRLSLFKSGYLFSDIILFFDAGISWQEDKLPWNKSSKVRFQWMPDKNYYSPITSVGASLRINLFGIAILEPYIAKPFQLDNVNFSTGFIIHGGGF